MLLQFVFILKIIIKLAFVLREIFVLTEPALGHLCYLLTDVLPQPNFLSDTVFNSDQPHRGSVEVQKMCHDKICLVATATWPPDQLIYQAIMN